MQSVSSRIWTRLAVSTSCDDNHYTMGTSTNNNNNNNNNYYYYYTPCEFFPPALVDDLSLESGWLRDSFQNSVWSQQCHTLDHLDLSSDFQLFQPYFMAFRTVHSVPITLSITIALMFYNFFSLLSRSKHSSLFSISMIFTLSSVETTKRTIGQFF